MSEIIYGRQPVLEALKAGRRQFEKLLIRVGVHGRVITEILRLAEERGVPVEWQEGKSLETLLHSAHHQGVVLIASSRPSLSWQDLLREVRGNPETVVGFVDRVEDPRNLGAIIRTASFFGFQGLIVSKARTAPVTARGVKASCGGSEFLEVVQVNNFPQVVQAFQEAGFFLIALEEDGERCLWDIEVKNIPVGLVVGGEDRGIRRVVRSRCDFVVRIPRGGVISSLNVSVAFGIGAYEIARQKRSGSIGAKR